MSLLAQLYMAGMLTLSLPLLFHFLRRSPRGVLPFSTLMFLSASPPRLTRRSRIDHWLLLLLRASALALLVLAFCRPYFRQDSRLGWQLTPGRRVAVLVDSSASMRRAGLWQQAEKALDETLNSLSDQDAVALFAFDRRLRVVSDYAEEGRPAAMQVEAVRLAFKEIEPSWSDTSLGAALASLAARMESREDREGEEQPLQIVLISDLQSGAELSALQAISWPERVSVEVKPVVAKSINASVHVLERSLEETDPLAARLRVVNNHSAKFPFELHWTDSAGRVERASTPPSPKPIEPTKSPEVKSNAAGSAEDIRGAADVFEAPAHGSKVVRSRRPEQLLGADRVVLNGDDEAFDNTCYVVPPSRRAVSLQFWGDESTNDAEGLRFYLENAAATAPHHDLTVATSENEALPSVDALKLVDLVAVTRTLSEVEATRAREAVEQGARLLLVLRDVDATNMLKALLPQGVDCELAEADAEYSLLTDIDFKHPIFAPLSSARYSDFTKVQFWRHRRLRLEPAPEGLRVLAKFDDGDLAIAQWTLGEGEVTLFTSGWNPKDSRLALSTKFVPLASGLLDRRHQDRSALQFEVDEMVPRSVLGDESQVENIKVAKPDGDVVSWGEGAFQDANQPGIYLVSWKGGETTFAVNLPPRESRTQPIDQSVLAKNGVRLGQAVALGQLERQRQRLSQELEGRQKLWQWLIAACLIVLILETVLAGRYARRADTATTPPPPT